MTQSFRKIKLDSNDIVYSKIIRFGKHRCDRCNCVKELQCAHIISRGHYATRFMLEPFKNAVALCSDCHDWFDSHKAKEILFDERLQAIKQPDNRWWWLVNVMGYTWEQLLLLHAKGETVFQGYSFKKKEIGRELKAIYIKMCLA